MTESLEEKFQLQYWSRFKDALSIQWAFDRPNHVSGDCYMRAIRSETDAMGHNRRRHQNLPYTEPMTLAEARAFLSENKGLLGSRIHDCIGLQLEDTPIIEKVPEKVFFPEPIHVRYWDDTSYKKRPTCVVR